MHRASDMMSYVNLSPRKPTSLLRAPGLLLIADTPKGRGVFASQPIARGSIVEVSPVLVFSSDEVKQHTSQTCLQHYTYYWPAIDGKLTRQAVALGLGSMFNHSASKQNVVWSRDVEAQCVVYTAHRDIEAGEELCISYGSKLWFDDTDIASDDEYSKIKGVSGETCLSSRELDISGLSAIDV